MQMVNHDGHLDYVVNGRLIHPVEGGGLDGQELTFEDHGSIRVLEDEFLDFYETLDFLSESADKAVESYCDLCLQDHEHTTSNLDMREPPGSSES